jgi:hypothetical protein
VEDSIAVPPVKSVCPPVAKILLRLAVSDDLAVAAASSVVGVVAVSAEPDFDVADIIELTPLAIPPTALATVAAPAMVAANVPVAAAVAVAAVPTPIAKPIGAKNAIITPLFHTKAYRFLLFRFRLCHTST